jgi:hypothetical protein
MIIRNREESAFNHGSKAIAATVLEVSEPSLIV